MNKKLNGHFSYMKYSEEVNKHDNKTTPTLLAETLPCTQTIEKVILPFDLVFQDFIFVKLESAECDRTAFCISFTNILRAGKSNREIPAITTVYKISNDF